MEKISVIIPVYNTEKYVEATVRSVMAQTYDNLEIICVNDGSTDSSLDILNRLKNEDDRIIVLSKENSGLGESRNFGMDVASSEWISFIDSDDILVPYAYERIAKAFEYRPDLVHFGIQVVCEDGSAPTASDVKYYDLKHEGLVELNDSIIFSSDVSAANKLFRKSLINRYGIRFGKILYEDFQFSLSYMSISNNVFCIKDKLYNYLRRRGSIMSETFDRIDRAIDHMYAYANLVDFIYANGMQKKHSFMLYKLFISSYMFSIRYSTVGRIQDVVSYSISLYDKYDVLTRNVDKVVENGCVLFKDKNRKQKHTLTLLLQKILMIHYEFINYESYKVVRIFGIMVYKKKRCNR